MMKVEGKLDLQTLEDIKDHKALKFCCLAFVCELRLLSLPRKSNFMLEEATDGETV